MSYAREVPGLGLQGGCVRPDSAEIWGSVREAGEALSQAHLCIRGKRGFLQPMRLQNKATQALRGNINLIGEASSSNCKQSGEP